MLRKLFFVFCSMVSTSVFAGCGLSDHVRPLEAIAENVNSRLQKHDFKALDELAIEYRRPNAIASDGQPKLMGFYQGVSKSSSECGRVKDSDDMWMDHRRLLREWNEASPNSVAPKIAMARFEVSYGWHARGHGYASSVTDEGWKLFNERIANARAMEEKLAAEASTDPQWYATMLDIAQAQGWERKQFDAVYAEAVKKFPFYYDFYFSKASFYSAKWNGSQKNFKDFVDEAVTATEAKIGQTMYARLNWSAQEDTMFQDGQANWGRMKQGFDRLVTDYPDLWNRNNYAKFACMAGDAKTVHDQLAMLRDKIILSAWGGMAYFQACQQFANQIK
jgi:hypothetical protein